MEGWYQKYAAEGFVVVGVHTPEFAFEHDTGNVPRRSPASASRTRSRRTTSSRPGTPTATQYWPAHYLIDATGHIRAEHFGEGDYDETEADIRALLAGGGQVCACRADRRAAAQRSDLQRPDPGDVPGSWSAGSNFASGGLATGTRSFSFPGGLDLRTPGLSRARGTSRTQYITATQAGDKLELSLPGRDVYLVMSAPSPVTATSR